MEKIKRNGCHTTAQRDESPGRTGGTQTSWKALPKEITFYVFSGRVSQRLEDLIEPGLTSMQASSAV